MIMKAVFSPKPQNPILPIFICEFVLKIVVIEMHCEGGVLYANLRLLCSLGATWTFEQLLRIITLFIIIR